MDALQHRPLTHELAGDLAWLEEHCRRSPELAPSAGRLRLAAAVVRNAVGPFLEGQRPPPVHVAVVGGAGTGKSTVVNFLCGTVVAEANPQAGFTRHPVAYTTDAGPLPWAAYLHFLGPLQRLPHAGPSNIDEDVYQVRRVDPDKAGPDGLLREAVVWDCPDMTTWASTGYVPRLLEACGLADVIVFVASDERYNDEVPTQFLQLLLQAGKTVVCVLTKMNPEDVPVLTEHFRQTVLTPLKAPETPLLAVPFLKPSDLADPAGKSAAYRLPLVEKVRGLLAPAESARERTVRAATAFLGTAADGLMAVARHDLEALDTWRGAVQAGQAEFNDRYRREFLTGAKFARFDEARAEVLETLHLPPPLHAINAVLDLVRFPYTWARDKLTAVVGRPQALPLPEEKVLREAFSAWLDRLRVEAMRRLGTHPIWAHVVQGFDSRLSQAGRDEFEALLAGLRRGADAEIARAGEAVSADLTKRPLLLAGLRAANLLVDVAAIGLVFLLIQPTWWHLALVPAAVALSHQAVEGVAAGYVSARRERSRRRQLDLVARTLTTPLADWLAAWPATGGSAYERLQLVLQRVPLSIRRLDEAVAGRLMSAGEP